jgi:DNA polymerase III epsilon subunit-like protein
LEELEMRRPFSNNVIFYDTEFSSLDPYTGEVLSIGMVKISGEELNLELEPAGPISDWVKEHVIPTLKGPHVTRQDAQRRIKEFVGGGKPYAVGYVNAYDTLYFYKLFGFPKGEQPCYWLPVDLSSIIFGVGKDPEKLLEFAVELGIDTKQYTQHHALHDARLVRDVYMKFFAIEPE